MPYFCCTGYRSAFRQRPSQVRTAAAMIESPVEGGPPLLVLRTTAFHHSGLTMQDSATSSSEFTKVTDVLSGDEIRQLKLKSNLAGATTLVVTWLMISGCFALIAQWPNPLTILFAWIVIAGRQLGLAVITHDAAHQSLFRTPTLNRLAGNWLSGAMVLTDMDSYFAVHQVHHRCAGSADDPDLMNYKSYAVSKASLWRKVIRDLTGQTGVKALKFVFSQNIKLWWRGAVANLALFTVLTLAGYPLLYVLWIACYLTSYMLISRLRQAAEHAVVPQLDDADPRMHTRTTIARWWERLILAPNYVNYHLEHHLLPGIAPHQYPKMHRLLKNRGFYENADVAPGYVDVVSRLTVPSKPAVVTKSN
jgi:fatty acid desaturase